MSLKTKITLVPLVSMIGIALHCQLPISTSEPLNPLPLVQAETIEVPNPLNYSDVNSLSSQIRSYLLLIVGGIAIIFIAVSGILYVVGGATMNEGMINMAKKALIGSIAGLVIIMAANMLLQEIYYIVLGKTLDFNNLSAKEILMRLVNFLLAIVGILFLISMLIGGIWYFASGGDESRAELGKKTIRYSIIGLVIALAAMILLRQINRIITGA